MSKSYNYNPIPPRAWSRVQNPCTYIIPGSDYTQAFVPLTGQTISQTDADNQIKMIYKGNILQYKGNSARLTKTQKYSQLARCAGPNRTKVFATQTETYSNPNTTGLLRAGYTTYPYPNQIVGAPNNISGPFAYNIPNPNDCSSNSVQDGGILVCGTYINPCSNEIIKRGNSTATICNESSASNVPGSQFLCWNKKVQTWFPKQRYFMNNSTNKWPINYKGLVSALKPSAPILNVSFSGNCTKTVILTWTVEDNNCIPITSYNIYLDGVLLVNIPVNTNTYSINLPDGTYEVYIKALSDKNESLDSNKILILLINNSDTIIISYSNISKPKHYNENGYTGVIIETTLSPTNSGYGEASFITCKNLSNVQVLIVGGGGGGGGGYYKGTALTGGAGGGGGGITYISGLIPPTNTIINLKVGSGGKGGNVTGRGGGFIGNNSSLSVPSFNTEFISFGGTQGFGGGSAGSGGGDGGDVTESLNGIIATPSGYGGGGGGGAYSKDNTNTIKKGKGGNGYTTIGNDGGNGSTSSSGSGGSSNPSPGGFTYTLPFLGETILVGGGGGGGGKNKGGSSGNGYGGYNGDNINNTNNNYYGQSATNYGGGGGGGSQVTGSPETNYGGNGGNGVIIIWWNN